MPTLVTAHPLDVLSKCCCQHSRCHTRRHAREYITMWHQTAPVLDTPQATALLRLGAEQLMVACLRSWWLTCG